MSAKTFLIINRHSEKALQTTGEENGSTIVQSEIHNTDNQLWSFTGKNNSTKIVNKSNGLVLDLFCSGTENGTYLHSWENTDSNTQLWSITVASRGYRCITNIEANKAVDIKDLSTENDGIAQIWDSVGGLNQEWKLVEYPAVRKKTSTKKTIPNTNDKMKTKMK